MQQGNIKKALDNLDNAGYRLRCAREYMGLSEKQVADELKLMVSHVRAIEQNRSEYLVQRKPFERYLRAYARLVQLNPDAIVAMYFADSEPVPAHAVDITTRREIPQQPVAAFPDESRWSSARNNHYHPALLGAGFLVIGLSLFAGWGVKQLVGSSQTPPRLAQSDVVEVRASTRRQPQPVATAAVSELTAIQFNPPVTSVPSDRGAEPAPELQPIEVAVKQRAVLEAEIDKPPESPLPVASEPVQVASQTVELQNIVVGVKQRPIVEPKPVIAKATSEQPSVATGDAAAQPPNEVTSAPTSSDAKPAVALKQIGEKPLAVAVTADPTVIADTAAAAEVIAKTPSLKPVTVTSKRRPAINEDATATQLLAGKNASELSVVPTPAEQPRVAPAAVVASAVSSAAAADLQPIRVTSQQRAAVPPAQVQAAAQAEEFEQIVTVRPEPLSASVTMHSSAELDHGPDLEEEASDLQAVIDAGVADDTAQPFEIALSNSSDSASVARLALLESYKSTLRRRVYENVTYPGRARRRNQEGKVVMSATVSRGGELLSVEMSEASKYRSLNRASEKAIKKSSPFPAAPDTLSGDAFVLTVPVVFKVPER